MPEKKFITKSRLLFICGLLLVNVALALATVKDTLTLRQLATSYSDMQESSAYLNNTKMMVEDMLDYTRSDIENVIGGHVDQQMISPSDLLNSERKNDR